MADRFEQPVPEKMIPDTFSSLDFSILWSKAMALDYPNTPQALLSYTCDRLDKAFKKQGEEQTRRYIDKLYKKEKKAQLDTTMAKHGCAKAIVAIVFDSDSKALLDEPDIQNVVEDVFYRTGTPDDTHFLLFTGTQTLGMGDEVAIWPPIA
ncbi:MAG: hypothetical protein FJ246_04905 [Nitrospira sp.]|nr:hypothetical protein [Nitrospira sp.]